MHHNYLHRALPLVVVLLAFGCGTQPQYQAVTLQPKSNVKASSAGEQVNRVGSAKVSLEGALGSLSEVFVAEPQAGKIDIAWIVDQSGSMVQETANVQKNLKSFIGSVNAAVDARHALIGSSSGQNALKLDTINTTHKQIEFRVDSNDALQIAITAFTKVGNQLPKGAKSDSSNTLQGSLNSFFREGVKAAVVVVTDDNAKVINETNFLTLAKTALAREPIVFAFRGANKNDPSKNPANCGVAADGVAYDKLAEFTKGLTFDICDSDWSKSFAKLTEGVIGAAKNTFQLKRLPSQVSEVSINGVKIESSKYSVIGPNVTISPEVLSATSKSEISIKYNAD